MVMLPHQQTILNVFQPQYTLMFETLLATPEPWYYLHVHLPGGADNLANPEYALVPGSKAPLAGTLMQVVSVERLSDARLILVVQGLGRAAVLRATQQLPYARADVQLLPDREALLAASCEQPSRRSAVTRHSSSSQVTPFHKRGAASPSTHHSCSASLSARSRRSLACEGAISAGSS